MRTAQRKPGRPNPEIAMPPADGCPVAALIRPAEALIQAREKYEEKGHGMVELENNAELIEIDDALEAIESLAGVRHASSLEGALFQLVLAHNHIDLAVNGATETIREAAFRAASRILWSIREAIASVTGAVPSETISHHYMYPSDERPGAAIAAALLKAGVDFTAENGGGPGVRRAGRSAANFGIGRES